MLGSPLAGGEISRDRVELRSLGGECSNQYTEGKAERDMHRQSVPPPCTPQLEMLVCWCGRGLGAEAWASDIRPGEKAGTGCKEEPPERAGMLYTITEGVQEKAWARQKGKAPLLGGRQGEGQEHHRSFLLCTHTLRQQGTTYMSSGGRQEAPLPSQAPKVGMGHCCRRESYEQAPIAAPNFLGVLFGHCR